MTMFLSYVLICSIDDHIILFFNLSSKLMAIISVIIFQVNVFDILSTIIFTSGPSDNSSIVGLSIKIPYL